MTKKQKIKQIFDETKQYFIQQIDFLCSEDRTEDACAMHEELREWLCEQEKPIIFTIKRSTKI